MFCLGSKGLYCVLLRNIWDSHMPQRGENDEIRWQVVKAMLDEFPSLREKVKAYIEKQQKQK
jgi:uncharacterized protein YdaU (DUF1376 family)